MKIIVPAIGSRGDVQPYLNLCQELQAEGHQVILALNPTLCPLAGQHGLTAVPVGRPVDMGAEGARLMASSFGNMWIGLIRVMRLASQLVEDAYADTREVCRGADLVITTDSGGGIAEAESLGIPWISVTLQPGRIPIDSPPLFPGAHLRLAVWQADGHPHQPLAQTPERAAGAGHRADAVQTAHPAPGQRGDFTLEPGLAKTGAPDELLVRPRRPELGSPSAWLNSWSRAGGLSRSAWG